MSDELKPCPFCGGKDIRVSDKTTTISWKKKRHVACYCNDCHCYGSRIIGETDKQYPNKAIVGVKDLAIKAWNKRTPIGKAND